MALPMITPEERQRLLEEELTNKFRPQTEPIPGTLAGQDLSAADPYGINQPDPMAMAALPEQTLAPPTLPTLEEQVAAPAPAGDEMLLPSEAAAVQSNVAPSEEVNIAETEPQGNRYQDLMGRQREKVTELDRLIAEGGDEGPNMGEILGMAMAGYGDALSGTQFLDKTIALMRAQKKDKVTALEKKRKAEKAKFAEVRKQEKTEKMLDPKSDISKMYQDLVAHYTEKDPATFRKLSAMDLEDIYPKAGDLYKAKMDKVTRDIELGLKVNKPPAGLVELNKQAGKDVANWNEKRADAYKGIDQLSWALKELKANPNIVGGAMERMPKLVREALTEKSVAVQEAVEEVVQRNLRLVLGAQFTEKEGERLIARAYNQRLSAEENIRRITRLVGQIQEAAEAKDDFGAYFIKNNYSMRGYEPKYMGHATAEEALGIKKERKPYRTETKTERPKPKPAPNGNKTIKNKKTGEILTWDGENYVPVGGN